MTTEKEAITQQPFTEKVDEKQRNNLLLRQSVDGNEKDAIAQQLLDAFAKNGYAYVEYSNWEELRKALEADDDENVRELLEELASLAADLVIKEREQKKLVIAETNNLMKTYNATTNILKEKIEAERSVHKTALEQVKDFYEKEQEKEREIIKAVSKTMFIAGKNNLPDSDFYEYFEKAVESCKKK